MKSLAKEQSVFVTVQMHRDTEGCVLKCEVATTVSKEPVAKNCSASVEKECDRVVDRWRKLQLSPVAERRYT